MVFEMLEEEFDDKQAQTHACGIQIGMMRAASHLRKIAGLHFQGGHDKDANLLRAAAQQLEEQAKKVYTAPDHFEGVPWKGESPDSPT